MIQLTQQEIEQRLEKKYLGAVVSIRMPWPRANPEDTHPVYYDVSTKIHRISVELIEGEPMVIFIGGAGIQYKCDVNYFIENATIHGNTHTGRSTGGGLPKGD